jgi:PP-loop superfamily ATP-utilizing enzyme
MSTEAREGDKIAVWFSSGAASAVAAKLTVEQYGNRCDVHLVNNPVREEDPDNLRFLRDIETWIGVEVEFAVNADYPSSSAVDVWDRRGGMVFPHGAPCTVSLKKHARQQWEAVNKPDWHVLGFHAGERRRHEQFILTERANVLPVLIDAGLTKEDCFAILRAEGIVLPRVYSEGFPNANCIGCVKATSPTYWNHVRQQRPAIFAERAEQSRRLGVKLVRYRGRRIYLDELPPDARGRPMKSMKAVECGLFCEEPSHEH